MNKIMLERIDERIAELGTSRQAVSIDAGHNRTFLAELFSGKKRSISADALSEIARSLKTTPQYLTGETFVSSVPNLSKTLPVIGRAAAASIGSMHAIDDAIDWLQMPAKLANVRDAYALTVEGDSMLERYQDGDPIYVNPHQTVRKGDICVVQEQRGSDIYASVKEFSHRTDKSVVVRQFNPKDTINFETRHVAAVHRVLPWREVLGF